MMKSALAVLALVHLCLGSNIEELIANSTQLVKIGLKTYGHLNVHLAYPFNDDFSRLENWFEGEVLRLSQEWLETTASQVRRTIHSKDAVLEKLVSIASKTDSENKEDITEVQVAALIDEMLKKMKEGEGSLDFEIDNLARTGLADVYFFVKSAIAKTANIEYLRKSGLDLGFTHPMIQNAIALAQLWSPQEVEKVLLILLGVPGLETKYLRLQLAKVRPSLAELGQEDYDFLLGLGEWINDKMNTGLISARLTFATFMGQLTEELGNKKDGLVPKVKAELKKLKSRKETLGLQWKQLLTMARKFIGKF